MGELGRDVRGLTTAEWAVIFVVLLLGALLAVRLMGGTLGEQVERATAAFAGEDDGIEVVPTAVGSAAELARPRHDDPYREAGMANEEGGEVLLSLAALLTVGLTGAPTDGNPAIVASAKDALVDALAWGSRAARARVLAALRDALQNGDAATMHLALDVLSAVPEVIDRPTEAALAALGRRYDSADVVMAAVRADILVGARQAQRSGATVHASWDGGRDALLRRIELPDGTVIDVEYDRMDPDGTRSGWPTKIVERRPSGEVVTWTQTVLGQWSIVSRRGTVESPPARVTASVRFDPDGTLVVMAGLVVERRRVDGSVEVDDARRSIHLVYGPDGALKSLAPWRDPPAHEFAYAEDGTLAVWSVRERDGVVTWTRQRNADGSWSNRWMSQHGREWEVELAILGDRLVRTTREDGKRVIAEFLFERAAGVTGATASRTYRPDTDPNHRWLEEELRRRQMSGEASPHTTLWQLEIGLWLHWKVRRDALARLWAARLNALVTATGPRYTVSDLERTAREDLNAQERLFREIDRVIVPDRNGTYAWTRIPELDAAAVDRYLTEEANAPVEAVLRERPGFREGWARAWVGFGMQVDALMKAIKNNPIVAGVAIVGVVVVAGLAAVPGTIGVVAGGTLYVVGAIGTTVVVGIAGYYGVTGSYDVAVGWYTNDWRRFGSGAERIGKGSFELSTVLAPYGIARAFRPSDVTRLERALATWERLELFRAVGFSSGNLWAATGGLRVVTQAEAEAQLVRTLLSGRAVRRTLTFEQRAAMLAYEELARRNGWTVARDVRALIDELRAAENVVTRGAHVVYGPTERLLVEAAMIQRTAAKPGTYVVSFHTDAAGRVTILGVADGKVTARTVSQDEIVASVISDPAVYNADEIYLGTCHGLAVGDDATALATAIARRTGRPVVVPRGRELVGRGPDGTLHVQVVDATGRVLPAAEAYARILPHGDVHRFTAGVASLFRDARVVYSINPPAGVRLLPRGPYQYPTTDPTYSLGEAVHVAAAAALEVPREAGRFTVRRSRIVEILDANVARARTELTLAEQNRAPAAVLEHLRAQVVAAERLAERARVLPTETITVGGNSHDAVVRMMHPPGAPPNDRARAVEEFFRAAGVNPTGPARGSATPSLPMQDTSRTVAHAFDAGAPAAQETVRKALLGANSTDDVRAILAWSRAQATRMLGAELQRDRTYMVVWIKTGRPGEGTGDLLTKERLLALTAELERRGLSPIFVGDDVLFDGTRIADLATRTRGVDLTRAWTRTGDPNNFMPLVSPGRVHADYSMQAQLQLLEAMRANPQIVGQVGVHSGMMEAGALLGMPTLSLGRSERMGELAVRLNYMRLVHNDHWSSGKINADSFRVIGWEIERLRRAGGGGAPPGPTDLGPPARLPGGIVPGRQ